MKLTEPIRFPLSVGSTPATLAMGVALFGFLGGAPVFFGSLLPDLVALLCGLLIAVWFFSLCALPFSFRKERASDLRVGDEGVAIHGGRFGGSRLAWSELAAPSALRLEDGGTPPRTTLSLSERIAVGSEEPDEQASLTALADSLSTLVRGYLDAQAEPPAPSWDPRVLRCPGCAAPQPVPDAAQVRCRFCDAVSAVPEPLRAAVRDAAATTAHRRATRSALVELQRWRSARAVNVLLGVALLPLALSWPVMAAFTSEFFQYYDILRWRDVFILFAATCALSVGLLLLVQSQLALRRAFALVASSFHARPPERPGWPYGCRQCAAPLAVAAESPLAVCPYCQADNVVLGVLLPHAVAGAAEERGALDQVLAERARERRRWRLYFLLSLVLMAVGGKVVGDTLGRVRASRLPRHAPVDRSWRYEPAWVQPR